MQGSWWHYRHWKFAADMNGDGALTASDFSLWAQWLFYMPGDAFIAQLGPTALGRFLGLTQASFGGAASACISAALWLVGFWASFYLWAWLIDAADPTYRQHKRERRQAEARAQRELKARVRRGRRRHAFFWFSLSRARK